jgi:hypothetical protein
MRPDGSHGKHLTHLPAKRFATAPDWGRALGHEGNVAPASSPKKKGTTLGRRDSAPALPDKQKGLQLQALSQ